MKIKKTLIVSLILTVLIGLVVAQPAESPSIVGKIFYLTITFNEPMDTAIIPVITLLNPTPVVTFGESVWTNDMTFVQNYTVGDDIEISNIDVECSGAKDVAGNIMVPDGRLDVFSIDTKPPIMTGIGCSSN